MSEATYRFELAKQGRAGCQNSACKNAGIKIGKGEFRMGTLVYYEDRPGWKWKHWGCVTPRQIKNLQDQVGPLQDLDLDDDLPRIIDGYDEIDDESREKIKFALQHGHVADEDWKGEPDLNRPGQKGINRRTPKKKAVEDDEDDAAESGETPSKPKPKKGRGKKAKAEPEDEDDIPISPVPKKKAAGKRKVKDEEDDNDAEEAPQPKKARTQKRKAAVKDEDKEEDEAVEKPAKRQRAKKIKAEDGEEGGAAEQPAKKSRAKKAKAEEQDDEEMPDARQPEPAKRERIRKRKNTAPKVEGDRDNVKPRVLQNDDATDDLVTAEKPSAKLKRARAGRKGKAVKQEDHIEEADDADNTLVKTEVEPEVNVRAEADTEDEAEPAIIPEGYIGAIRQDELSASRTATTARAKKLKAEPEDDADANVNVKAEDEGEVEDKVSSPAPDSAPATVTKTDAEADPAAADTRVRSGLEEGDVGATGLEDAEDIKGKPAKGGRGKRIRKTAKGRAK